MNIFKKLDEILNAPSWAKQNSKHTEIFEAITEGRVSIHTLEKHYHVPELLKILTEAGYIRNRNSEPGFNKGSLTHWVRDNTRIELVISHFMGDFINVHILDQI
ncbi:hypothetical protein CMI47_12950 [Candidatus Pacearchaeota archaeon]|nr:hypothetical protein [Candidatus Pacearchaeota archaeon]|tara:strand:+ start:341 stop:652 length:312 start_codon:yes stop_codon:yes gene_type:complete